MSKKGFGESPFLYYCKYGYFCQLISLRYSIGFRLVMASGLFCSFSAKPSAAFKLEGKVKPQR
jgi:hypothetical protein